MFLVIAYACGFGFVLISMFLIFHFYITGDDRDVYEDNARKGSSDLARKGIPNCLKSFYINADHEASCIIIMYFHSVILH